MSRQFIINGLRCGRGRGLAEGGWKLAGCVVVAIDILRTQEARCGGFWDWMLPSW